jgi:anti-anti-sigma factor
MMSIRVAGNGSAVPLPTSWESRTARFSTYSPTDDAAVITAVGEIDAANADRLGAYALQFAAECRHVVLHLSGVEFFGAEGFAMLQAFNAHCAQAGVRWVMVPSVAVVRVLRICDPDGEFPTADDVDGALETALGEPRRRLQLVT